MTTYREKVQIYTDEAGERRWRSIGGNGEKMAGSTEGLKSTAAVRNNMLKTMLALAKKLGYECIEKPKK